MAFISPTSASSKNSWQDIFNFSPSQLPLVAKSDFAPKASVFDSRKTSIGIFSPGYRFSKRVFDMVLCISALPALLLLFSFIVGAIWLEDRSNPFFFQVRTGLGGKRFRMYKFRTMVPNAEEMKKELMHLNELEWPDFKIKNDPRITRVGKFLRRTSLDELPQLFNVFLGDMSLVGPRPTSFKPETYKAWHMERLEVIPGLTGLWQVSGRSNLEFDERVQLDIEYIQRQSMWYDLNLIFKTFETAILKNEGAY